MWSRRPYAKRQEWVPLARLSTELQHAVIAAEDGRFYQHKGIDWKQVQKVVDQGLDSGYLPTGRRALLANRDARADLTRVGS